MTHTNALRTRTHVTDPNPERGTDMLTRSLYILTAAALAAAPLVAQDRPTEPVQASASSAGSTAVALAVHFPPTTFEEPKALVENLDGIQISLGGSFMQSFQSLSHSNAAAPAMEGGTDTNALADIGAGFTLAAANLNLTAQFTPGMKVVVETYLASRHHNEAWVKGGYLQFDESPLSVATLDNLMEFVTLKVGHYEPNYGDALYRRSNNGSSVANPFVENLILDAHTTEIGGEVITRMGSLLGVFGVTNGQIKGDITTPDARSWAFISKVGVDHMFGPALRGRLTLSSYQNDNAGRATLFGGDRAGSAYWGVMDNAGGRVFTNGRVNPNFTEEIRAYQLNPFIQVGNLELFGVAELARGQTLGEQSAGADLREVRQYAGDVLYRLLDGRVYAAGRYNVVDGELLALGQDQTVKRGVLGAGWFVSPNVLLKGEYVRQTYDGFAATHVLHGGEFDGIVVQGAVTF